MVVSLKRWRESHCSTCSLCACSSMTVPRTIKSLEPSREEGIISSSQEQHDLQTVKRSMTIPWRVWVKFVVAKIQRAWKASEQVARTRSTWRFPERLTLARCVRSREVARRFMASVLLHFNAVYTPGLKNGITFAGNHLRYYFTRW